MVLDRRTVVNLTGAYNKCPGCAYEQGFDDATNGNVRLPRLSQLDQSQAGTVRHKDPICSLQYGL